MTAILGGADASVAEDMTVIYARAGLDPSRPPGPVRLAVRLLGDGSVSYGTPNDGQAAQLVSIRGEWRIIVDRLAPDEAITIGIARAVAHWVVDIARITLDLPLTIDELAPRIALPRVALQEAVRQGLTSYEIARRYVLPEPIVLGLMRDLRSVHRSGLFASGE